MLNVFVFARTHAPMHARKHAYPYFVRFRWFSNPGMLTKVDTSTSILQDGDFVYVVDSIDKVKALQDSANGGWNAKMEKVSNRYLIY